MPRPLLAFVSHWLPTGQIFKVLKTSNGLPAVQNVLKEQFGGRLVNEQNLSEWKQGGHPEWLRHQETRSLASKLAEQSDDLDEAAHGQKISDCLAGALAAELARLAITLLEKETDPEKRWSRLCEVHREISRLRRHDHRAVQTLIQRQNWIRETDRQDEEDLKRAEKDLIDRHLAPLLGQAQLRAMAELFGGGERGLDIAAYVLELQKGLPPGSFGRNPLPGQAKPPSPTPSQTKSNRIKPNQTNFSGKLTPIAPSAEERAADEAPVGPDPSG